MPSTALLSLKRTVASANNDLTIRCDVASILASMVNVMETAEHENKYAVIQKRLVTENFKLGKVLKYAKHLEKDKINLENELNEFRTRAITLRDNFAHDVGQLLNQSRANERLKEKLREAELKLAHFDAIEAEWMSAKRRIRELERISASFDSSTAPVPSGTTASSGAAISPPPAPAVDVATNTNTGSTPAIVDATEVGSHPTGDSPVASVPAPADAAVVANTAPVITATTAPTPVAEPALVPVVVAPRSCRLADLEEDHFVLLISFLDMADIMGVLLTCRHLCARVYIMFDISFTEIVREVWLQEEHKPQLGPIAGQKTITGDEPVANATAIPPTLVAAATGARVSPAPSAEASLSSLATSLFNASRGLVAGSAPGAPAQAQTAAAVGAGGTAAVGGTAAAPGVLTQDMVGELTKKLTPNELKAIVSIKEREQKAATMLKEAQRRLDEIKDDKEMLVAKLESTEQSRDFLAQKIAGAERALKGSFDEVKVLKTQLSNDEKIIAYLDQQQQEVSLASAEWKRKYEAMHTSFELQRSMHGQMEAAWRTQINQSAAQWEAGEKDYKAQKKLLVKEVKTLRINLLSANADRDKYHSQIQLLKNALG